MSNRIYLFVGVAYLVLGSIAYSQTMSNSSSITNPLGSTTAVSANSTTSVSYPNNPSNTQGSFSIVSIEKQLPSGASMISRGEVLNINRETNSVTIRNPQTHVMIIRSIKDAQTLDGFKQGDLVQVYNL